MERKVDTKEYLDMICSLLAEGQTMAAIPVAGYSMNPFLSNGDTAYLNLPDAPLKKGDVVLYTRPGGQYVLHRIVKVNRDGSFIMLGDAQSERERVENADRIHARMVSARHKGKLLTPRSLRWRFFATVWIWVWPWRRQLMKFAAKFIRKTR